MIFAFRISSQAGLGRAELLAEGIYLALMTTAAGLTIAIPCLLLNAWFNTRADKFLREIDELMLDTTPCFARIEAATDSARRPVNDLAEDRTADSDASEPLGAALASHS
jgi:biopolymer transport protein ExbB/TolQ